MEKIYQVSYTKKKRERETKIVKAYNEVQANHKLQQLVKHPKNINIVLIDGTKEV